MRVRKMFDDDDDDRRADGDNECQTVLLRLPARYGASECSLVQLAPRPRVPTVLTVGCVVGA